MPQIKQIVITPKLKPEEAKVQLQLVDDDGTERTVDGLAGLTIIAITDLDYFVGIQGNIMFPFYVITSELSKENSMLSQLYLSAVSTAIQQASKDDLLHLFKSQTEVMNLIADRQEKLRNEHGK